MTITHMVAQLVTAVEKSIIDNKRLKDHHSIHLLKWHYRIKTIKRIATTCFGSEMNVCKKILSLLPLRADCVISYT